MQSTVMKRTSLAFRTVYLVLWITGFLIELVALMTACCRAASSEPRCHRVGVHTGQTKASVWLTFPIMQSLSWMMATGRATGAKPRWRVADLRCVTSAADD